MAPGPNRERASKIYKELRSNLIENVFKVSPDPREELTVTGVAANGLCLGAVRCGDRRRPAKVRSLRLTAMAEDTYFHQSPIHWMDVPHQHE